MGGRTPANPDNLKETIRPNLRIAYSPVNHFSASPQRPESPIVAVKAFLTRGPKKLTTEGRYPSREEIHERAVLR